MSFYDAIRVGASGAADDFTIDRSVRFNRTDNHLLKKQPSSAGNRRTFTISTWVKRSNTGVNGALFYAGTSVGANHNDTDAFLFNSSDKLTFTGEENQSVKYDIATSKRFRDAGAWYHIVLAVDTTQGTASNRIKIYVNGVQETSLDQNTYPSQNYELFVNSTVSGGYTNGNIHVVGYTGGGRGLDGYLAEYHLIDGQQLTPDSFAETKATTGQWIPKDTAGLTYGTNGFRLQFLDNSSTTATTLGKDTSGNGNNYTPDNFGGTAVDQLPDTPTNNFATFNALKAYTNGAVFDEGSLRCTHGASGNGGAPVNFGLESGKWYVEMLIEYDGNGTQVGISGEKSAINSFPITDCLMIGASGEVITNGSNSYPSLPVGNTFTAGDIIGMALDITGGTIKWYKNNSLVYTLNISTMTSGGNSNSVYFFTSGDGSSATAGRHVFNAGQDSTFRGNKTKQGNADDNGIGDFYYSPPSGHLAVCSANLPDPTILLPGGHFNCVTWTGNTSASRDITGVGFKPGLVSIKARTNTYEFLWFDAVRGAGKRLFSHNTGAESDNLATLNAFITDGFRLGNGSSVDLSVNGSASSTYVSWNWFSGNTDSVTYRVVVVSDSGNKYRFRNSANTATFAQSAVTLDLAEGGTYTFDQSDSTMSSHPMKLSTTANGTHGGGSSYNTGVTYELDGSTVTESAFVSGFSSATSRKLIITVAASAPTLYYFCHYHSGMGGQANTNSTLGSSNFDGTIQSTVKTNASAGFSIVTYTGTGADGTIGHGLGAIPDVAITKKRSATQDWLIKHSAVSGKVGYLNLADQFDNSGSGGGIVSDFSSSLNYSITRYNNSGNYGNVNESSATYVAYVFSAVKGYSKFGSYTGNNSSNGPFIFTGFKPAFILSKAYDSSTYWYEVVDNKRVEFNPRNKTLYANASDAEYSGSQYDKDLLSNGFKARGDNAGQNGNFNYIYIAFAESPFKNNRGG